MNEQKTFNVGDRVRFKGDYLQYVEDAVSNGGEYLITDVGHDSSEVTLHCPVFIDNDDLELVEHDPKTAFLSELKGLLEKYDASIYVDFNQSDEIYTTTIAIGEDGVKYNLTDGIDCDNIMDYDKE